MQKSRPPYPLEHSGMVRLPLPARRCGGMESSRWGLVDGDSPSGRPRRAGIEHGDCAAPVNRVIHHGDQGSQYTSTAFGLRCRHAGVRPSMGTAGDAYVNAMGESFFAMLECELLDRNRFQNQAEARMAMLT